MKSSIMIIEDVERAGERRFAHSGCVNECLARDGCLLVTTKNPIRRLGKNVRMCRLNRSSTA